MNHVAEYSVACAEATESFDDLVARATEQKERVVLTRHGKPVAALVPSRIWTSWKRSRISSTQPNTSVPRPSSSAAASPPYLGKR